MTVQELIDELSKHNPNHMVIVNGYGDGFNEVRRVSLVDVKLHVNSWYEGMHDIIMPWDADDDTIAAIVLGTSAPHQRSEGTSL